MRRTRRVLVIDDDRLLCELVRTTFELEGFAVDCAHDVIEAEKVLSESRPDAILLDIGLPGVDGVFYLERLREAPQTRKIPVVAISGSDEAGRAARAAGAAAFLRKPFSPLELLAAVERLAGQKYGVPFRTRRTDDPQEQLLLYAQDLRHILEIEKGQRALIQSAYRETVMALASALESKDTGTRAHSQRVQQYATELAREIDTTLLEDPSTEYGFLLHDVGKIGIPDRILQKPKPLTAPEERLMRTHTVLGEQVLSGVAFLHGEGLRVVRSHHERWNGDGYPDGLAETDIPLSARVFAVADALDAMTSDRPYRRALPWPQAGHELVEQSGRQFDPVVVAAFLDVEDRLRAFHDELGAGVYARSSSLRSE
jgi:cyclic di-GMP phosphodiesterase